MIFRRLLSLVVRFLLGPLSLPVFSGANKGLIWKVGAGIHSCWLGNFEAKKQEVIASFLRPGMTTYDIGALAGFYTLAFSRGVGETGACFAFEPNPQNLINLLGHVRLNGLRNVSVVAASVSERTSVRSFNLDRGPYMGFITGGDSILKVPSVSLDEFVGWGNPIPDLVKIDVEGEEAKVLAGARRLLSTANAVWFIALHSKDARQECWEVLRQNDYQLFGLNGQLLAADRGDISEVYAVRYRNQGERA